MSLGQESFRTLAMRPLNRIPEYVRALEELDQSTPMGHEDLAAITRCLQAVKATAALITDNKAKSENSAQLYRLQTLVTGIPDDWDVLGPTREYTATCVCSELFPGALLKPAQHPTKNSVHRRFCIDNNNYLKNNFNLKKGQQIH